MSLADSDIAIPRLTRFERQNIPVVVQKIVAANLDSFRAKNSPDAMLDKIFRSIVGTLSQFDHNIEPNKNLRQMLKALELVKAQEYVRALLTKTIHIIDYAGMWEGDNIWYPIDTWRGTDESGNAVVQCIVVIMCIATTNNVPVHYFESAMPKLLDCLRKLNRNHTAWDD